MRRGGNPSNDRASRAWPGRARRDRAGRSPGPMMPAAPVEGKGARSRSGGAVRHDPPEAVLEGPVVPGGEAGPEGREPRLPVRPPEELDEILRADPVAVGEPGAVVRHDRGAVVRAEALDRPAGLGDRAGRAEHASAEPLAEHLGVEVLALP